MCSQWVTYTAYTNGCSLHPETNKGDVIDTLHSSFSAASVQGIWLSEISIVGYNMLRWFHCRARQQNLWHPSFWFMVVLSCFVPKLDFRAIPHTLSQKITSLTFQTTDDWFSFSPSWWSHLHNPLKTKPWNPWSSTILFHRMVPSYVCWFYKPHEYYSHIYHKP